MNTYSRQLYAGMGGKFCRFKSVDRVIREARKAKWELNVGFIQFVDDNFVGSMSRLREFSDRFPEEVGLPVFLHTSAEMISDESIRLLKSMGLQRLGIGVETGNERYRKEMLHKNTTDIDIFNAVRLAKENGIIVTAYYMIGLPGDTRQSIEETIRFNEGLNPSSCFVSTYFPFPGTPLHDVTVRSGVVSEFHYLPDFYGESILKFGDLHGDELKSYRTQFKNVIIDKGPFGRRDFGVLERSLELMF